MAPAAAAAKPEGQGEHTASPVPPTEYVPGSHALQAAAPAAAEKLPAPQALQPLLPEAAANVPGAHAAQEAGAETNVPGAHRAGGQQVAAPAPL